MEKFLRRALPQGIGFILMIIGWYMSIIDAGLVKFSSTSIITTWTLTGLVLILIGAYLPQIWIAILNKMQK
jgi:hypothetical protein